MKKKVQKYTCPRCQDPHCTGGDFGFFDDKVTLALNKIQDLKFGELAQCPVCDSHWLLEYNMKKLFYIAPKNLELITDWNERNLSISDDFLKVLNSIRATPIDVYGNGKGYIFIPCKCTLKTAEIIDYCLVSIQRLPPIDYWFDSDNKVIYLDEVLKIEESEYTLPADIRVHTTEADELHMGYAPSWVQAPNKKLYVLNWTNHFFDSDGIKGKDLILPKQECNMNTDCKRPNFTFKETYIITDWKDEYQSLYLEHTQR